MNPGRWRRVGLALGAVAAALYLPFGWLVPALASHPEAAGRWLKLAPILPGFVPGAYLFYPNTAVEYAVMGAMTLALLASLTSLGSGGGRRLGAAAATALLVAIPSAIIASINFPWR